MLCALLTMNAGCVDRDVQSEGPLLKQNFEQLIAKLGAKTEKEKWEVIKPEVVIFSATYKGAANIATVDNHLQQVTSELGYSLTTNRSQRIHGDAALVYCHDKLHYRYISWIKQTTETGILSLQSEGKNANLPQCTKP